MPAQSRFNLPDIRLTDALPYMGTTVSARSKRGWKRRGAMTATCSASLDAHRTSMQAAACAATELAHSTLPLLPGKEARRPSAVLFRFGGGAEQIRHQM